MRPICNFEVSWIPLLMTGLLLTVVPLRGAEPAAPAESQSKVAVEKGDSSKPDKDGWVCLFDGKSLGKWEIVKKYDFDSHGEVRVADQSIILESGAPATGIRWTGDFPKMGYEVSLEARRTAGYDFFCGLTFPVGDKALTLVCGGWGGGVTGLSCIDGEMAIDTDTCTYQEYKEKQWYRIRLRVQKEKIEVWLDDEQIVNLPTENRQLSLYMSMEPTQPLGICTWQTTGELRQIRVRPIDRKTAGAPQETPRKPE